MALYLGLELATDQLRASIIDENLELAGVECVDYDTELTEYGTQGGIFTTPGEAYTTPVEMWIKALDLLLEKLHRNHDLSKIKAIGGSAQHALVWWKSIPLPSLSSLDPHLPLHAHFPASSFALPNTPTSLSTASHAHALAIEALLGGPDAMKARVGVCANPGLAAGQMLRVRESLTRQVWERTGRVQLASAWLCSMIAGKWTPMVEQEAVMSGIWSASTAPISRAASPLPSPTTKTQGGLMATAASGSGLLPPSPMTPTPKPEGRYWDEGVLDIVGGSREEGRRVRGWLGEVDVSGKRVVGTVGKYLVERYGFEPDTVVTPFIPDFLATYMSLVPNPGADAVLSFGPMDLLMTEINNVASVQNAAKNTQNILYPHPVNGGDRRYIAVISSRNADVARALVRDMYTKSWSAFDRLVAIVPPGGSIGLDDKLFAFWHLTSDSHPYSHVKGIYRFETGIKVNEFRDLRANPRCLVESQILSMRVKHAMLNAPVPTSFPPARILSGAMHLNALGVHFDPTSIVDMPKRILATGGAANFPSIVNMVGDAFNAPVLVPMTQVKSAGPDGGGRHRNAPQKGFSGRAGIGAAMIAWFSRREDAQFGAVFEEAVRKVYDTRWEANGKVPPKSSVLPEAALPVTPAVSTPGARGSYPGTPTSFGGARGHMTGLGGTSVLIEEDEEDMDYLGALRSSVTASTDLSGLSGSLANSNSTKFTTPDLSLPSSTEPTPLSTVTASNSTTDEDIKEGLARVAVPDLDGFLAYAGILSEFVRLESTVLKGIV